MTSDCATGRQPVHEAEVDGVPVFWVDTPGRLHAQLVFGVGLADESFLTTGVTHLVEHLVMRQLGEFTHAANAGVSVVTTSFEVSSSPATVVDHLRRLCLALAEPDVGQLDIERRVIGAEEHTSDASPISWWPLATRYGPRGPGLTANRELAPHLLGPAEVADWCRRWLHRGNAVLVLNGPPPADLALPLPAGPPVEHAPLEVLELPTPAWSEWPFTALVATLHGSWSAELAVGLSVLSTRLTRRLRHEAGLVYDLGLEATHLPDGTVVVGVGAEVPEQHVGTVVERLLDTLDELCDTGPTEAELAHDRETLREIVEDPEEAVENAMAAAVERLVGIPSRIEAQGQVLAGVRADDVAATLREVRRSLIVGLPEGHHLQRLPELPGCSVPPITGRALRRATFRSDAPRGSQLVVGTDGISLILGRGAEPVTVRFADVVAVGVEPGPSGRDGEEICTVLSRQGDCIPLVGRDWRDGRVAVEALRAAVPADRFYDTPEGMRLTEG